MKRIDANLVHSSIFIERMQTMGNGTKLVMGQQVFVAEDFTVCDVWERLH